MSAFWRRAGEGLPTVRRHRTESTYSDASGTLTRSLDRWNIQKMYMYDKWQKERLALLLRTVLRTYVAVVPVIVVVV